MSRHLISALLFCLAAVLSQCLGALAASGTEEEVMIDRDVLDATRIGKARVLVEVRLPESMKPDRELTPAARFVQEHVIATAQGSVLAGLAGRRFSLVRRYETVPLLLLDVQDDAVMALDGMVSMVVRVRLDTHSAPPGARAAQ